MRQLVLISMLALALAACKNPATDTAAAKTSDPAPAGDTATAAPAPLEGAVVHPLSAADSRIEWTGSKVTGSHTGLFQKWDGRIELVDGKIESSRVWIEIDTTSIHTDDSEKLLGHLKSDDFFAVEKHPRATFLSTEIKAGGEKGATHTITGDLELRGVKKSISFPATIAVSDEKVSGTSEFWINRKDFGLLYTGAADDLIRDEVVIKLTLDASRKEA